MLKNSLAGFWGLEETGKANLLPMTEDYSFKKNALRVLPAESADAPSARQL